MHAAGAQKTAREAKEIMKDMNVQLDNLCQVHKIILQVPEGCKQPHASTTQLGLILAVCT